MLERHGKLATERRDIVPVGGGGGLVEKIGEHRAQNIQDMLANRQQAQDQGHHAHSLLGLGDAQLPFAHQARIVGIWNRISRRKNNSLQGQPKEEKVSAVPNSIVANSVKFEYQIPWMVELEVDTFLKVGW